MNAWHTHTITKNHRVNNTTQRKNCINNKMIHNNKRGIDYVTPIERERGDKYINTTVRV